MRFRFIRLESEVYPVRILCRVMAVSKSGYYAWRKRQPSEREQANQKLATRIHEIFIDKRKAYGSPRIWDDLRDEGEICSVNRVARIMRTKGIAAQRKPRYIVTTESGGTTKAAPNLLKRRFRPGKVPAWVADLTYVRTYEGVLYLAVVLNLASRRVIGWAMGSTPAGQLTLDALRMAIDTAPPKVGQIHYSDRGGHYMSKGYQGLATKHGMLVSMSRKGNCWDNAVVESFFATLKGELLYPNQIRTRKQAREMIFDYVEVFYNRQRKHSALGYLSPVVYEKLNSNP